MRISKSSISPRLQGCGSVLLAALLLAGCGIFESKKADYRSVQRAKPLDIPPELSAPAKDDRYTVSELGSKGTTFSSYTAERSAVKAGGVATPDIETKQIPTVIQTDKLRIERAGNQRWLVVAGTPDKVWPQVRKFVDARGFVVKSESAELGLIETDWVEKVIYTPQEGIRGQLSKALGSFYSTSDRDKYRIRLEQGLESGTTDVFISHRGLEEVYVTEGRDATRWQPRPSNPDLEAEMLSRLMQFVGLDEKKSVALVAAAATNVPGDRARLIETADKLLVEVDERFDRAWRRVGLALDRNGFTVEDRDRAKGIYFVRFQDALGDKHASKSSWFDSLAFWRDDKAAAELAKATFRVAVVGAGDEMAKVEVQEKGGASLTNASARRILEIVRSELK